MQKIIEIKGGVVRHPDYRMAAPVDFELLAGEQLAIIGRNGAGKSMLVDILIGKRALMPMQEVRYDFAPSKAKMVSDNIKYLTFRDSYGTQEGVYYYQQRWNQNDIGDTPLVRDLLAESFRIAEEGLARKTNFDRFVVRDETPEQEAARLAQEEADRMAMHAELAKVRDRLYEMFHLEEMLDKHVILLSSGELRKFQLTKTLLTNPRVLIMDNPFIGLDVNARRQLRDFLTLLTKATNVALILVLSKTDDIPDFITHVVEVKDKVVMGKRENRPQSPSPALPTGEVGLSPALPSREGAEFPLMESPGAKRPGTVGDRGSSAISVTTKPSTPEGGDGGGLEGSESVGGLVGADCPCISFNSVSIRYGSRTILKDLSFTVNQGEHWALSGENGAGKSTLLSIVCADNPQSYANDIVLFGHQRGRGESIWDIKRHIGYISPEMHRAYMRDVPAIDIVASGMSDVSGLYRKPKAEDREQCLRWMEVFGVAHLADRSFLKMSSGEQRLVLLARAFVKDPALLILDEPLHGLDNVNCQLVKDVIEEFCKRPEKTLLMVTHYEEELPACIDHRIVLKKQK